MSSFRFIRADLDSVRFIQARLSLFRLLISFRIFFLKWDWFVLFCAELFSFTFHYFPKGFLKLRMLSILCRKDLVTFALVKLFQKGDFYAFTRNYWFSVMKIKNNYKKFKLLATYRYEKKNYQTIITLWLKINIVNYYCKIF